MDKGLILRAIGVSGALLGAGVSAYLTFEYSQGSSAACVVGKGCEVVAESGYAHLGPIPTAAFGLAMYLVLAMSYGIRIVSSLPSRAEKAFCTTTLVVILAGAGLSAWLTYVELYVLRAICIWCVISASVIGLLMVVAVVDFMQVRGWSWIGQPYRLRRGRETS